MLYTGLKKNSTKRKSWTPFKTLSFRTRETSSRVVSTVYAWWCLFVVDEEIGGSLVMSIVIIEKKKAKNSWLHRNGLQLTGWWLYDTYTILHVRLIVFVRMYVTHSYTHIYIFFVLFVLFANHVKARETAVVAAAALSDVANNI